MRAVSSGEFAQPNHRRKVTTAADRWQTQGLIAPLRDYSEARTVIVFEVVNV
jgi:hypothetical protein